MKKPITGALTFMFTAAAGLWAAQYSIDSFTIAGGGGTCSGGPYSLTATIGQIETGQSSGQNYSLASGFWNLITDVSVPGAPMLTIVKTDPGTALVSWPSPSAGWFLEQNNDLNTQNWTPVTTPPGDDGTTKSVAIHTSDNNLFFRLMK